MPSNAKWSIRKKDFEAKAKAEGYWSAFVVRREKLKAEGYLPKEAWRIGMEEFENPDAVPATGPPPKKASPPQGTVQPKRAGSASPADPAPRLTPATWEGRKKSTLVEDMMWVYNHLVFDPADVDPTTAPSPGAVDMLEWARTPGSKRDFYKLITELLPSKKQLEHDSRFQDDGRRQIHMIERARAAKQAAIAKAAEAAQAQPEQLLEVG